MRMFPGVPFIFHAVPLNLPYDHFISFLFPFVFSCSCCFSMLSLIFLDLFVSAARFPFICSSFPFTFPYVRFPLTFRCVFPLFVILLPVVHCLNSLLSFFPLLRSFNLFLFSLRNYLLSLYTSVFPLAFPYAPFNL